MTTTAKFAAFAATAAAFNTYARELERELNDMAKFIDKVRACSTNQALRTEADILLSKRETINTGVKS